MDDDCSYSYAGRRKLLAGVATVATAGIAGCSFLNNDTTTPTSQPTDDPTPSPTEQPSETDTGTDSETETDSGPPENSDVSLTVNDQTTSGGFVTVSHALGDVAFQLYVIDGSGNDITAAEVVALANRPISDTRIPVTRPLSANETVTVQAKDDGKVLAEQTVTVSLTDTAIVFREMPKAGETSVPVKATLASDFSGAGGPVTIQAFSGDQINGDNQITADDAENVIESGGERTFSLPLDGSSDRVPLQQGRDVTVALVGNDTIAQTTRSVESASGDGDSSSPPSYMPEMEFEFEWDPSSETATVTFTGGEAITPENTGMLQILKDKDAGSITHTSGFPVIDSTIEPGRTVGEARGITENTHLVVVWWPPGDEGNEYGVVSWSPNSGKRRIN